MANTITQSAGSPSNVTGSGVVKAFGTYSLDTGWRADYYGADYYDIALGEIVAAPTAGGPSPWAVQMDNAESGHTYKVTPYMSITNPRTGERKLIFGNANQIMAETKGPPEVV